MKSVTNLYIDGPLPIHGNWIQQKYNGNSLEIADSKAAFTNSRMIKINESQLVKPFSTNNYHSKEIA